MGSASRKMINTDKLFYKIGEVSNIADIETHVLRYWESEFSFLKPRKNNTGQRVYSRKDLELVLQIKNLLYKDKYTIAGVRKKFGNSTLKKNSVSIQTVQGIRKKLKDILDTLNKNTKSRKPRIASNKKEQTQLHL
jgi:DNA-binding transcriptional MerR regulator